MISKGGWRVVVAAVSFSMSMAHSSTYIDTYKFFSRPDLMAPVLNVSININPAPGYIFLTPYGFTLEKYVGIQYGPYIYDSDGELMWSGASVHRDNYKGAANFHVCSYRESPHLCYTHTDRKKGAVSRNEILDETYTIVMTVTAVGPVDGAVVGEDSHEFRLVHASKNPSDAIGEHKRTLYQGQTTALLTSSIVLERNATLTHCDGHPEVIWVKSQVFQEISLDGFNTVLFEWAAIDHVSIGETNQCPDEEKGVTGNGTMKSSSFDFFHLNAIEKDEYDNYIISSRHTSTLYKINGRTGAVIWRLGGRLSDFDLISKVPGEPFALAYQHHVRYDNKMGGADGIKKLGITVWNNQNTRRDFGNKKSDHSSGYSILADEGVMLATLRQVWISPDRQLDASQGSHQVLPNRNHLIGMGNVPYMAEFDQNQKLVYYANLGQSRVNSYRYLRYPWVGHPTDTPSLFAYAPSCHGMVKFYVSWNGATEVKYWSFFVGRTPEPSKMKQVASASKHGFETTAAGGAGTFAYAVAHDTDRNRIGTSGVVEVFIPAYDIYDYCTQMNCGHRFDYAAAPRKSCEGTTYPSEYPMVTPLELSKSSKNGTLEKEVDSPIQIHLT